MKILLPVIILILLFCISMNMLLAVGLNTIDPAKLENNIFAQVVQENIKLRRHLYLASQYIKHINMVNRQLSKRLDTCYMLTEREMEL